MTITDILAHDEHPRDREKCQSCEHTRLLHDRPYGFSRHACLVCDCSGFILEGATAPATAEKPNPWLSWWRGVA